MTRHCILPLLLFLLEVCAPAQEPVRWHSITPPTVLFGSNGKGGLNLGAQLAPDGTSVGGSCYGFPEPDPFAGFAVKKTSASYWLQRWDKPDKTPPDYGSDEHQFFLGYSSKNEPLVGRLLKKHIDGFLPNLVLIVSNLKLRQDHLVVESNLYNGIPGNDFDFLRTSKIHLSRDGRYLAVMGPRKVDIWEFRGGTKIGTLELDSKDGSLRYDHLAFSLDSNRVIVASSSSRISKETNVARIEIYHIPTLRSVHSFLHADRISCIALSHDGGMIAAVGSLSGRVVLWKAGYTRPRRTFAIANNSEVPLSLEFGPRGDYLACCCGGKDQLGARQWGSLEVWNLSSFRSETFLRQDDWACFAFSEDESQLVSVSKVKGLERRANLK